MSRYHSYEEAQELFATWSAARPELAAARSVGQSVQGRELLVLHLTAGADRPRQLRKPMFKWVANMHGNEVSWCLEVHL